MQEWSLETHQVELTVRALGDSSAPQGDQAGIFWVMVGIPEYVRIFTSSETKAFAMAPQFLDL